MSLADKKNQMPKNAIWGYLSSSNMIERLFMPLYGIKRRFTKASWLVPK